jgi:hypothetical protein
MKAIVAVLLFFAYSFVLAVGWVIGTSFGKYLTGKAAQRMSELRGGRNAEG